MSLSLGSAATLLEILKRIMTEDQMKEFIKAVDEEAEKERLLWEQACKEMAQVLKRDSGNS